MTQYHVTRTIDAPVDLVFRTVSDINHFSKAVPHIEKVEFLTEQRTGIGTRFRETRLMNGRQAATELEVTEYVENDRVRMVADSHGTVWDSVFTVKPDDGRTELTLKMDGTAYKLVSKVMNAMIKNMIGKALEQDMDSVKTYCESRKEHS